MERMELARSSFVAFVIGALCACESEPGSSRPALDAKESATTAAPASARGVGERSFARISGPDEPGEPLEVSGRVFEPDGVTPAAGVVLYVYHTGADGIYAPDPDDPPRLRAWLVTDAEGRYRYRTIKPGSYPGTRNPAHVHTQLWSARFPTQYGTELLFEDDPFLTERERAASEELGEFAYIARVEHGMDGVIRATHDLRLKTDGDAVEDNTSHGVADAPAELAPRGR